MARDIDFCLRLDMPSGALPVGLADLDFAEDLPPLDFDLELLPLTEGFEGAIMDVVWRSRR